MNTKVKIGMAAVIVAALVTLIVLDQKVTRKKDPAKETAGLPGKKDPVFEKKQPPKPGEGDERGESIIKPRKPDEKKPDPKKEEKQSKGDPTVEEKALDGATEEYTIQQGDTFASIAEKRYGNSQLWTLIADANPDVKPTSMRVGKKIKIPAKPTKPADAEATVEESNGKKTYTVQPGDDLGKISQKIYNTTRHWERIYEANRDQLSSPDEIQVGMKLLLPEIAPKKDEPSKTTAPTDDALAGKKTHKVNSGDRLWNIADQYRGQRGILDMIELIVKANPDKLKSSSTPLKVGWAIVIPD